MSVLTFREAIIDKILVRVKTAIEAATECLSAITDESKVRTSLMLIELADANEQAEQAEREAKKASGAVGMMRAPYGYCSVCGEANISRDRMKKADGTIGSFDRCPNNHTERSQCSLVRPPKPTPPDTEVIRSDQTKVPPKEA